MDPPRGLSLYREAVEPGFPVRKWLIMKIAYVLNQYPYSSCTFIRREILGLEKLGLEVARYSLRKPELELVDEADKTEAKLTKTVLSEGAVRLLLALVTTFLTRPTRFLSTFQHALSLGYRSDRGVFVHLVYLAEACLLLRWFRADKIDHVHSHFANNATAVASFCRMLGGPSFSFTIHGPHDFDQPMAVSLGKKIELAEFVVGISSFTRSQLFRWCGHENWSRIHIVHCGVDDLFLTHAKVPMPTSPVFVNVGRFGEQKGHLILIEAVGRLAREGQRCKVVLVGDGPFRSEIERLCKEFKIEDQIVLAGWASDKEVRDHILNSQMMLLPSFAEGLPVVIMETLALRRPVIATYIAGIPELVTPECGWLVPSGSVEHLVRAMREAMSTPVAQLEAMGEHGHGRVAEEHNIITEAGKLAELFKKYATRIA